MNSSTLCSLLVALCMILILQSPLATKASRFYVLHEEPSSGPDLIDRVCNKTIKEDYALCQKVLRRYPEIVKAKNFTELTVALLKLGRKNAVEGQKFLKGLAKEKSVSAIEECATTDYDAVISAFISSLDEMKYDMDAANYDAAITGDGVDYCNIALVAAQIHDPKISALNREIAIIGSMAFYAMNEIGRK